MKSSTNSKIIEYIHEKKLATAHDLADYLNISRQAVYKQLKKLVENGELVKLGQPPKVFYTAPDSIDGQKKEWLNNLGKVNLTSDQKGLIENRYLYISPFGEFKKGLEGFFYWCEKTKQPIEKTAGEYINTLQKYDALKKGDLLDGTDKLQQTFTHTYLDKVLYIDFYSIERFGKTKLGQMLLYAKQSQNKNLTRELTQEVKPYIENIITDFQIDAVGFIPPTVKRELQFIVEFAKQLKLKVPVISTLKITSDISVPQKTLSKLEDRIENARRSIVVNEKKRYKNILLIDDAVGSGATLNETAKKIREQNIVTGKIIGLSITGSYKGFDVINEV